MLFSPFSKCFCKAPTQSWRDFIVSPPVCWVMYLSHHTATKAAPKTAQTNAFPFPSFNLHSLAKVEILSTTACGSYPLLWAQVIAGRALQPCNLSRRGTQTTMGPPREAMLSPAMVGVSSPTSPQRPVSPYMYDSSRRGGAATKGQSQMIALAPTRGSCP